jgi:hypothetical protein
MNRFIFIAFLALFLALSSCAPVRMVDFTVISSKSHGIRFEMTNSRQVEGTGKTLKEALDDALNKAGISFDLLLDGVVYRKEKFASYEYTVRGTAVRSSEMRAYLGEGEFSKLAFTTQYF